MEKILRQGNLALVKTQTYAKKPVDYYEIVQYYPNSYYGKENEYIKTDSGKYQIPGHQCFIDASCFKNIFNSLLYYALVFSMIVKKNLILKVSVHVLY